MSQCQFCDNSLEMYCQECKESYCHHCGIIKHLRNGSIQPHIINYLCEECEEEVSSSYCKSCEQNLCPNCDTKIHNKGKRAQHTREPIANCLCMNDIKLVGHLTLSFLKAYCDTEDAEKFTEQLDQMSECILKTQKEWDAPNIIFISVLDDESGGISREEQEKLREAMKKIRIKNFLLFESGDSEEEFASFKQNVAKELGLTNEVKTLQSTIKQAHKVYQILKNVKDIQSVYVFDTKRNDTYASALRVTPYGGDKKIFLNFDITNPQPFEVSPYSPNKPASPVVQEKGEVKNSQSAPQTQLGTNLNLKQKIIPEPFLPQSLLDPPGQNPDIAVQKVQNYWINSARDPYTSLPNQSFDETLLNLSNDQLLQKKNPSFANTHKQYPYMAQGISQRRQHILNDQPLKNVELCGSLKLSHLLQQELRKFADQGDLLIIKEDLVKKFTKSLQSKFNFKVDDILKEAEEAKIIHTTIRKFLDTKPIFYIGTLLDVLTIESLIWIVRSIKNDLMTPTEKLILSRVKECYGLKVDPNFWKYTINYILANQSVNQNKANSFDHTNIFPLHANKVLDPVTNTDTYVIYLTHDGWVPEDQGTVEENSEEWRDFLTFIGNFFKEEETSMDQSSKGFNQEPETQDMGKKSTWSSSVENVLNRSTNKKDKSLKISEDVKAIPGGRYGCAQFIKICGPESLKKLSIGRLTLFVQESINKGILRYQRTLLVKNNPNDSISTLTEVDGSNTSFTQDPTTERKSKMMKVVKDALMEILCENPEGIPLAQIPLHLKRKMDMVVNFQEYGFPKLKNFLATLPELVKIESSGTNHAFVKLKNPTPSFTANKNFGFKDQAFLPETHDSTRGSFGTMNPNPMFQHNLTTTHARGFDQKYITMTPSSDKNPKGGRKKVSSLDDYLNKVRGIIELILTDNCYGISIQKLNKELNTKLSCEFDVRLFSCKDFYEFLTTYVENLLDIEIKKNCLIIYPKNFRFGPKTLVNVINTEQQRISIKTPDMFEQVPDSKKNFLNNQLNLNASPFHTHKNPGEFEAPPGLPKPMYVPNPSAFSTVYNAPGFAPNYPQMNRLNPKLVENPGTSQNLSNISPFVFYGNEDNDMTTEKYPGPSQSSSYWNIASHINIEEGRQGISSRSHLNGGLHSRTDSRGHKMQEESGIEIRENLKFIEELLKETDINEKSLTNFTLDRTNESSFGGIQSPNLSFTGLTAIGPGNQTSKMNHSKTQSEDFTNKNILKFPNGHGRGFSAIDRKNE